MGGGGLFSKMWKPLKASFFVDPSTCADHVIGASLLHSIINHNRFQFNCLSSGLWSRRGLPSLVAVYGA